MSLCKKKKKEVGDESDADTSVVDALKTGKNEKFSKIEKIGNKVMSQEKGKLVVVQGKKIKKQKIPGRLKNQAYKQVRKQFLKISFFDSKLENRLLDE